MEKKTRQLIRWIEVDTDGQIVANPGRKDELWLPILIDPDDDTSLGYLKDILEGKVVILYQGRLTITQRSCTCVECQF